MTLILPAKKYKAILADPPWKFKTRSSKGMGRSADNHYGTMTLKNICEIPVRSVADRDSVLFLWATMPQLEDALAVIKAWGFTYKTCAFTWMKQRKNTPPFFTEQSDIFTGMGYWTRSNSEICLLATRGKPKRQARDVKQAILAPRREHSRKPDCVYDRIERLVRGPYLEIFSRSERAGWDMVGNEVGKFSKAIDADSPTI